MEGIEAVACVSCGASLDIGPDEAGGDVRCGACGSLHQIERLVDSEGGLVAGPDGEVWDPNEETDRVFGVVDGSGEGPAGEAPESAGAPAPARPPRRGGFRKVAAGALLAALVTAAAWEWRQTRQRESALLARVDFLEDRVLSASRKLGRTGQDSVTLGSLEARVEELDDSLSRMVTHVRMHAANGLQMDQSLQSARDVLVRQERELGKLGLKLVLLERKVSDKSRHAREAFELAQKKRRAADRDAVPIRRRITSLESKREALLEKYRALSVPRRPQGVVSTRRAAEIMREWETQVAPALSHLQGEIADVANRIRREQLALDELYADLDVEPED